MKKILKSIIATMLIAGITVTNPSSSVYVQAATAHDNPNGGLCDSTMRKYTHRGIVQSHMLPGHRLTDGTLCTPTRLVYIHVVTCSSCGAEINTYFCSECTEVHSKCGTRLEKHPSL